MQTKKCYKRRITEAVKRAKLKYASKLENEKDEGTTLCALCHSYLHNGRTRWSVKADTNLELAQRNEEVKQYALDQLKILNGGKVE